MSSADPTPALRRDVGLLLFALYGAGNIIGAGIYVLVGEVAGAAGDLAPLAFCLAAVVAGLSGFSYGELAARYPVAAGEAVYLYKAFQLRWLSTGVGVLILLVAVVSAATMARGFVGYFNLFVPLDSRLVISILLGGLTLLAVRGIAESARVAAALTLLEAGGLAWIIGVASPNLGSGIEQVAQAVATVADPASAIIAGAFLAFFAFIGFEDMVSIAEEVKRPERNMPRGILLAFGFAGVLYLLITVVAIATLPVVELAASEAPLAEVYRAATGRPALFIGVIGLVAVINGALIQIIKSARILYGMSRNGWLPAALGVVNARTRTPLLATLLAGGVVLGFALMLPLTALARLTSSLVLVVFMLVNIALIRLHRTQPRPAGRWVLPVWVPVLGMLASGAMLIAGV